MKALQTDFDYAKRAVDTVLESIQSYLVYPELLAQAKEGALEYRRVRQESIKEERSRTDKDIAAFRAKAVTWFPLKTAKADKKRFETTLKHVETGFSELLGANRLLNGVLLALDVDADFATANDKIFAAGGEALTAQTSCDDGLRGLLTLL